MRRRDRFLGFVAAAPRWRLVTYVLGSYIGGVVCFGVIYATFGLVEVAGETASVGQAFFFSLVTQATVGYGDALPSASGALVVAAVQIVLGVAWTAFLPAIVLVRLTAPDPSTIRLDRHLAFDTNDMRFRVRMANLGPFVGSRLNLAIFLRTARTDTGGRRSLPVAIRSHIAPEWRYPLLQSMMPTGFKTDPAEAQELPLGITEVRLHPAHISKDRVVIVEASMETPFGRAVTQTRFEYDDIVCGRHEDVQPHTDGPMFWDRFDSVVLTADDPARRSFCLDRCSVRPICQLRGKAQQETSQRVEWPL